MSGKRKSVKALRNNMLEIENYLDWALPEGSEEWVQARNLVKFFNKRLEEVEGKNSVGCAEIPVKMFYDSMGNIHIGDTVFDASEIEDELGYRVRLTEEKIVELKEMACYARQGGNDNDLNEMEADIEELIYIKHEEGDESVIFDGLDTNEYISASQKPERFIELAEKAVAIWKRIEKENCCPSDKSGEKRDA